MMAGKQFPADHRRQVEALDYPSVQPQLGNCATVMTLTAPNELTLVRNFHPGSGFDGRGAVGLAGLLAGFGRDSRSTPIGDKPVRATRAQQNSAGRCP